MQSGQPELIVLDVQSHLHDVSVHFGPTKVPSARNWSSPRSMNAYPVILCHMRGYAREAAVDRISADITAAQPGGTITSSFNTTTSHSAQSPASLSARSMPLFHQREMFRVPPS